MTSGAAQNAGRRSCPPAWPAAQSAELASWIDTDIEYTDLQAGMARKRGELADFLGKIRSDERLLDVGCGPVSLLTVLPPAAEKVAVDSLIDAYAARYPRSPDVRYAKQVSEALEFPDNHFDRVCCLNALDHFRDPFASLAEMSRVLRRGGTLLLEYENTSPLVRWACRRGYRPPLNRFHPHHLSSPV
ncbi:MAG: class I SAM-dependent methyltransferase, partial [Desulfobacterales bacterium]|nr:class I SAM-dependent methyltransferase [Desulfobacterales bacterium]